MQIDAKRVDYIAQLARVAMSPDECAAFAPQMSAVVQYVEQIGELDLSGVEPTYNVHHSADVTEPDVPRTFPDMDAIIANFPAREGRSARIKKVIG
jgi:aspartyl-tRNA(Asn)/glutamyl-tRNA(Gln) amidotransferase subunit C